MKKILSFIETNITNYNDLPSEGLRENEHNTTNKKLWGSRGVAAIKELAQITNTVPINISINKSGDCDRGYVSGFVNSKDGTKTVYISINDGMNDILYRTAKHAKDYTGGSNHTVSITKNGFDILQHFIINYINQ